MTKTMKGDYVRREKGKKNVPGTLIRGPKFLQWKKRNVALLSLCARIAHGVSV